MQKSLTNRQNSASVQFHLISQRSSPWNLSPKGCDIFQNLKDSVSIRWPCGMHSKITRASRSSWREWTRNNHGAPQRKSTGEKMKDTGLEDDSGETGKPEEKPDQSRKYWVKSQEVWVGPGTRETHSQPAVSPSSQETWGLRDSISISRGLFEQICGFSFLSLMELSTYVWPRNFMGSDQPCLTERELFNIKALQLPLGRCIKLIRHLNL